MEVVESFRKAVAAQMATLAGVTEEQALTTVEEAPIGRGDFCVGVARFNRFAKLAGKPADVAVEWAAAVRPDEWIASATAEGMFINFHIRRTAFMRGVLDAANRAGADWGKSNTGNGAKIVVEFSSPNIAKPFHAGHLRSTILGQFMVRAHRFHGYDVTSVNYLGDWGKQYGLLAVGFARYGSEVELVRNPIRHLFHVYVSVNRDLDQEKAALEANPDALGGRVSTDDEARALFRRMETGDPEALALWRRFRDLSIEEYRKLYDRLNVSFDVYSGESKFSTEMVEALSVLEAKGLVSEDRGAKLVQFERFGAKPLGKVLVQKSDGATLYITRDIAAAKSRYDQYHFEHMYYVVAAQQDMHFKQLFKILDLAGYEFSKKCTHVNFGMVQGMKTRKGQVEFLEDILNRARDKMLKIMASNEEKMKEVENPALTADILGLSAVMVQDFSARRIKDYAFSWKAMLAAEGDTGPFLQYTHARLASILRKATEAGVAPDGSGDVDMLAADDGAWHLVQLISRFQTSSLAALRALEPSTLLTYLLALARAISSVLSTLRVMNQADDVAKRNLWLYSAALHTLHNGLEVLGLRPLERM